jgi:type I restriction enzyme S subunit
MRVWPIVPLGELLTKSEEWIRLDPSSKYRQVTVKLWGQGVVERSVVTGQEIGSETRLSVRAHQFLISRIDARNGAAGLVPESLDGAVVSNDFPAFTVNSNRLDFRYLGWYSRTARFVDDCKAASEGTTNRVRLKEDRFYFITMPLPPIEEQRRIVERLAQLSSRIRAVSTLASEVGAAHSIFLERELSCIIDEHWEADQPLAELLSDNSLNGLAARPSAEPPGNSILRISAATKRADFVANESESRFLQITPAEAAKYALKPGDLLACRFNGNWNFVGRFALYSGYSGVPQVYPDKLIRFRVKPDLAMPEFVCLAMNSRRVRKIVEEMCATTAGNIGIAATDLKTVCIPVPALDTQKEVVRKFQRIQSSVGKLVDAVGLRDAEVKSLMPSILNRAFSGRL